MNSSTKQQALEPSDPNQVMIPGVKAISNAERLAWCSQQPMRAEKEQKPLDIGLWNPMNNQIEMF